MNNTRLTLSLLATALLSVGGCVNWSGDVDEYRKVLDGGNRPATRPTFDPHAPLTLQQALRQAEADNEAIALRGEDYVQAMAEKMRQAGTFLPTLSLVPSYSLVHGTTDGQRGTSDQSSTSLRASATGSLSQASGVEAAGKTIEQRAQLLLDQRETVLLQVAQSYYDILRAERQTAVFENSLNVKKSRVADQETRQKLGNTRPLDVAQSQADLAATRVSLTQARTDGANARSALARLMGVADVNNPLTDNYAPPAEIPDLPQWIERASQSRQDLIAAARGVEAARLEVDAAIREYFPSVSIDFQYFLHNDPGSAGGWTGGISANVPIFSGLAIEANIRRAWSVYRQAGLAESQVRRQVIDEVNQNYLNLLTSRQKIIDLQIQVEAAQRAFDLADRAYQLGSESNLDRLAQQDNLLTAQLNLLQEQFNEKTNYLGLLRATGLLANVIKIDAEKTD